MTELTHEERRRLARQILDRTLMKERLRESTLDLVATAWADGEETYCVSNQYAIELLAELEEARRR